MARILHMADFHLDSPFTSKMSLEHAKLRRSEQREVFSQIIETAKKDADVVLISGDLFDGENVSGETVNFLVRKFAELGDIPVFISAGNHDPYNDTSVYSHTELGDNVHVFSCRGEYFDLDSLKLRVCGASFSSKYDDGSGIIRPTELEKHPEYANILVIHGDIYSIGGECRYNPISEKELDGFDYAALGHIHKYSGLNNAGNTVWAYPGIPEPRGFDETGNSGIIVGEVCRNSVSLKFQSVAKRRYRILNIELPRGISDNEGIIEKIAQSVGEFSRDDIFRIILNGKKEIGFKPDLELILNRTASLGFYIELKDETETEYDLTVDEADNSLRAEYIRLMNKKAEVYSKGSREYEIVQRALRLGVDAMESKR